MSVEHILKVAVIAVAGLFLLALFFFAACESVREYRQARRNEAQARPVTITVQVDGRDIAHTVARASIDRRARR